MRGFAILGHNLENIRKSPRVADESMFGGGANNNNPPELLMIRNRRSSRRWKGMAIICGVVWVPILSLFSCFSQPRHHHHTNAGVWAGGEFAQISEINHLMVSDSMRYAILM